MVILVIDNYDSFTYNLVQYVGDLGFISQVVRNDSCTLEQVQRLNPSHIIISPGPGLPNSSGISLSIIKYLAKNIPILGVCLGHQSIGLIYGANVNHAPVPIHGKTSFIYHNNRGLFFGIVNPFIAARYHSLIIDHFNLPPYLTITAWTEDGLIMACEHKLYPLLKGIQFHPESLWTIYGKKILQNFLC
uniref:Anthranilate synthase component 2 n=1 Tax=Lympha mucosa TaxID=2045360 RepID=A0A6B9VRD0_9FLOR|nr:anthranilate synthase component II [Lympha mucosa]